MPREETEHFVRDRCFRELLQRFGRPDTFRKRGDTATFDLREPYAPGECETEGKLFYTLPSGSKVSHKNDILLSRDSKQFFAIECKFLSAVSDQFKSRAYDMLQLKREMGDEVIGIMVYVHRPGSGISLEAAKAFCYPFDHFLGFHLRRPEEFDSVHWHELADIIEVAITKARAANV